ncbi:MAG: RNA polymerase sigma factor [Flavobacteriales bacterium]
MRKLILLKLTNDDIQRIRQQDERYLEVLYRDTFPLLMSIAVRYKNNHEEQLTAVHNAFLKMIKSIDQFQSSSSFEAWLAKILRNELIDDFRRTHKKSALQYTELTHDLADPTFDIQDLENTPSDQLLRMLNALPAASKIVFNLYAMDDYSIKQISEMLDITSDTVKWHLKTARKKLRASISNLKIQDNEIE